MALHVWSDVGVFPILGMDWRDRENQGQEILAERLAGWQEQYPDVHVERIALLRQAFPVAAEGIRTRSTGGGR